MKIIDYLKENHYAMRSGLPIELRDLIDERSVYAGNYEKRNVCAGVVTYGYVCAAGGFSAVSKLCFCREDVSLRSFYKRCVRIQRNRTSVARICKHSKRKIRKSEDGAAHDRPASIFVLCRYFHRARSSSFVDLFDRASRFRCKNIVFKKFS